MRMVVVAILLVAHTACSLTTMERARSDERPEIMPRCTGGRVPVIADAFWATTLSALAIYGGYVASTADSEKQRDAGRTVALWTAPFGLAHAASTYYGYRQRSRCQRARDRHERWLLGAPRTP